MTQEQTMRGIINELVKRIGYDIHKRQETVKSEQELIDHAIASLKSLIGREVIGGDREAKYINSPDAVEYNNKSFLETEGYNQAKAEARKKLEEL